MRETKRITLAFQLMTRLPFKKQIDASPADYAGSAVWFFLTSLAVGAVMVLAYFIIYSLTMSVHIAAFCAVIGEALVTGGLHIDGFADMCDAFGARKDKERTLEILKDSRMGTYGVIAIVFVLAIKTGLMANLSVWAWPIIFTVPVCGKISLLSCAAVSKYARKDGLGKYIIDGMTIKTSIVPIALCAVLVELWLGYFGYWADGAIVIAAAFAAGVLIALVSKSKIGGATGDILGAANETGEMLYLLILGMML